MTLRRFFGVLLLTACGNPGYDGQRCAALTSKDNVTELSPGITLRVDAGFIRNYTTSGLNPVPPRPKTPEFECCLRREQTGGGTCSVDCDEYRRGLRFTSLGGKYRGELCQGTGASECAVYFSNETGGVVATSSRCLD